MAATVQLQTGISFTDNSVSDSFQNSNSITITSSTGKRIEAKATIATTDTTISNGAVTNIGLVKIRNLDPTNYIQVGIVSAQYSIKIKAGEEFTFRANGNTLHLIANTASCSILYTIIED